MSHAGQQINVAISETPKEILESKEQTMHEERSRMNVGKNERHISLGLGVALGLLGVRNGFSLRGLAMAAVGGGLVYRGLTGSCSVYQALGISTAKAAHEPSAAPSAYNERSIHVEESVTIRRPAEQLYRFWRKLENLPKFMDHLQDVRVIDSRTSRWSVKAPLGSKVEWDAQIINDEPNRLIAWRSVGNAQVDNSGSVRFVPAADEPGVTDVHVTIDYIPPAGRVGDLIARLFGESPQRQVKEDLHRLKQMLDGEELVRNALAES